MITEESAGGVLFDKGDIFVLRKPNGEWVMPKGHIESGETPEEAAIREVAEETGLSGKVVARIGQTRYRFRTPSGEIIRKVVHWYLMEVSDREPCVESTFEEGVFLPADVAVKTLTFENDREIVRQAIEEQRKRRVGNG